MAAIVEPLLIARRVLREQLGVLHRQMLEIVRHDEVCRRLMTTPGCQSASDWDPRSASKRDPFVLRFERLALAPSELVVVAEAGRARVVA